MDFARPEWLWLLAALPIAAAATAIAERRRRAGWRAIAQPGTPTSDGGAAWLAAMALLGIGLAQPRWGREPGAPLPPGRDVVLMVDVSWSMAAEDVAPDRLGRAVRAAEELTRAVGREPGDRVAVVAFAGRGVIRCPLTTNLGAVIEALRGLRPGGVEPGGSDLGAGLDAALDAFGDEPRAGGRVVIVLSDGEDHDPSWEGRLDRLRRLGVVVHAVAIGDADRGHPIPIGPAPRSGERPLLVYRGAPVETRRVDAELRGLALAGGGAFVPIGLASADFAALYERHIAPVERRAREALGRPERAERFGLFLLAALAVGLVGSWPRRRPAERRTPWWASWAVLIGGVTASAGMLGAATDGEPRTAAEAVAAGRAAFERGDPGRALAAFERAERLAPESPIPPYNAAATLYRLGRFEEARARYLTARGRADERLRLKIDYALGNVALALRDPTAALGHYDDCLASTAADRPSELVRAFARENRAFAARLIASEAPDDAGPGDGGGGPGRSDDDGPPGPDGPGDRPEAGAPGPDEAPEGAPGPTAPTGLAGVPGSGAASGRPSRRGDSPADRLDRAVAAIRDARERRLPELPRVPPPRGDRPNW